MKPARLVRPPACLSLLLPIFATFALAGGDPALAQEGEPYVIQGTVVDPSSGRPLPNVTVQIRGTGFGAVTDAQGSYVIRASIASGDYTLVYSFVGRNTTTRSVTLGANRTVSVDSVALPETAIEMDQIAVTIAGQETERAKIANSVESVAGERINQAAGATSVDQALQGKVAGAVIVETSGQPGGGVSIRLRGASSILGGGEPLIVLDGVLIDNDNEALISLSGNAVRGGQALTNRLGDLAPSDIEKIEVLKGSAAAALYGSRANNGVIQIFTKSGRQGAPRITLRTEVSANENPDTYDLLLVPRASIADVALGLAENVGDPVERFDIQDEVFRTGYGTTNSLSVAGGNESTSYYLSAGLHNEDGILESTGEERKDVRVNLTQQVNDRLQVVGRVSYIDKDVDLIPEGEQTQGVLTSIIFTPPSFDPFFDPELGRFPYNPILGANPFDVIENWVASEEVNRFIGSFEGRYGLLDNLSVRYLFGLDDYRLKNTFLQPPFATSANFTGSIQTPVRFSQQITSEATADHDYLIPGIEFSSLAGYRYTRDRGEVIRAAAQDLPPETETVTGATQFASQSISVVERAELFFQEQVTFGDRLTLTGAFNYEGASAFGSDERWQLYPKFGAAWLLDREPWWEGSGVSNLLSTLKLRAAYGESGGQPPGAYELFNNFVALDFAGRPGRVPSLQLGNEGLKPEREREIEGGFTAGLLDDRVSVDFTYYHDRTDDLILSVPQTPSRGVAFQLQNIGELENRGWELSLETVNLSREDLTWRSRLALAGNENEVQKLVTAQDSLLFGYLTWVIEDQPVGVFYGWHYARDENGNIILGEDGIPDRAFNEEGVASRKFLGDPNPDLIASLANTFSWGPNLDFYVLFDGRFGNEVANFSRRISEFFGADPKIAEEISGDKPQGFYARNVARLLTYEEFIEPGWFVKLREVSASYRFTQPWVASFGARGLTVRLAGRNLYTWTDYSGLDPEINLFGFNTVARGVDFANAPIPRTVSASLTFEF